MEAPPGDDVGGGCQGAPSRLRVGEQRGAEVPLAGVWQDHDQQLSGHVSPSSGGAAPLRAALQSLSPFRRAILLPSRGHTMLENGPTIENAKTRKSEDAKAGPTKGDRGMMEIG